MLSLKIKFKKNNKKNKKLRHHFANKCLYNQSYGFSSSHVWIWDLDHKNGWMTNHWCFWTVVLEETLESPLNSKEIKTVNPKGNQLWIFIGSTDDETKAPILWPPDAKSWLIRKNPDAGKDWRQEENGTTEVEMVGWHHRLNGCEFQQAPGDGEGQRSLECFNTWSRKESDTTERLIWSDLTQEVDGRAGIQPKQTSARACNWKAIILVSNFKKQLYEEQ